MQNLAMQRKIQKDEAIDVAYCPQTSAHEYILSAFHPNVDYCDSVDESWIWSIGKHKVTGVILAARDGRFYKHPDYECLFLR